MPFIEIDSENIFYDRNPVSEGPVILFIHGSGGDHTHWPESARRLNGYRAIAPDLPGHGRSGGHGCQSVGEYAKFITRFVQAVELDDVTLVGHSLGGAIVQHLAFEQPEWLSRIVLVGTGARLKVLPEVLDGLLSEFHPTIDKVCRLAFGPDTPAELFDRGRVQMMDTATWVVHGDYSACNDFDSMDRIGKIDYPALILSGGADQLTPEKYGQYLHEKIRGSRHVLIPDAGHMMALEKPDAFTKALINFIEA